MADKPSNKVLDTLHIRDLLIKEWTKWRLDVPASTYQGSGITGRATTPSVYQSSGVKSAKVGQTYLNNNNGYMYECKVAGGPSKAKWSYIAIYPIFSGTGITGTDSKAHVFKKSKVAYAPVGSTYINKNTGNVYICRKKGEPDEATWAYEFTVIIGKPRKGVQDLSAPKRGKNGSHVMTSTLTVPKQLGSDKNGFRATTLTVTWKLSVSPVSKTLKVKKLPGSSKIERTEGLSLKSTSVNLNSFYGGNGHTYTRNTFYPRSDLKLTSVTCSVRPRNVKGEGKVTVSATTQFYPPKAPTIAAFSFDKTNGTVSTTITTDAGNGIYERYDTWYSYEVYGTRTKSYYAKVSASSTSTSIPLSCDIADYQQMGDSDYVRFVVKARSRGYAGDSGVVEKTYYLAFPKRATIYEGRIGINTTSGRAVIPIKTNHSPTHPCRKVQLEILPNVPYSKRTAIPADAPWTQPEGVVDDGDCTGLTCDVSDLQADAGNYTWVRVRSWSIDETVLQRVSEAANVGDMHSPAPTAGNDSAWILSLASGEDGASAVADIAWGCDGHADDATGTEVTWAQDENAWISTEDPKSYSFTRSDGAKTVGTHTYSGHAVLHIRGLPEGEETFVRARRYLEADSGTTYGAWSNAGKVVPSIAPTDVVLMAPASVPTGSGISLTWTYSGGAQRGWRVMRGTQVLARGTGSAGSCTVPASVVAAKKSAGSITMTVEVTTGGGTATSNAVKVIITEPPTLALTLAEELTAQPLSFSCASDTGDTLVATLVADGTETHGPTGVDAQPAGDTVWSGVVSPTWATVDGTRSATVTLPGDLDLRDGATYTLAVTATDAGSGLSSAARSAQVAVAWARQAPVPDESCVTLEPQDYYEGDGTHHQSVAITLAAKASADATGHGTSVTLGDVAPSSALQSLAAYGQTVQDGDPTPEEPVPLDGAAPTAIALADADGTSAEVAIDMDGHTLDRLPDGTQDELAIADDGTVTLTKRTARTTEAATIGVTGIVGADVLSSTGEIADGADVLYALDEPTEVELDPVTMPGVSEGTVVSVASAVEVEIDVGWLTAPTAATDVWDVYRVTGDGAQLIGEGLPLATETVDEWAPFGTDMDLSYRIACRTADGDVAWSDFEYAQDGGSLRFDWEDGSVELPYDIAISDAYKKGVDIHDYLDGATDAYYDQGVRRTARLSTDVLRLEDQVTVAAVRALARHPGTAYVRTPDGSAYEADVQVSSMGTDGGIVAVAIDATEVRLAPAHMLPAYNVEVTP